ncbi:phenylacetate--CoA ligase family protein [Devosia sp. 1566]|uniref:phenylacetate--CoA ligase family protein n=1 Tax=Devosia sp. 1566 TaxID=2499144 RepID=UPI000FD8A039|nr:phenylacetate--CoA ligase family protein [Devosia sp. 1566]
MANVPHANPVVAPATGGGWPYQLDNGLARLLVDCHMIAFHDRQSGAAMRDYQFKCIAHLLGHARKHSSWWRERLTALDSGSPINLIDLPLMGRADFRASLQAAGGALPVPPSHGQVSSASTSGSSGIPLTFHSTGLVARLNQAQYWQDRIRQGVDSSRTIARFSVHLADHDGEHVTGRPNPVLAMGVELQRRAQQFTIEQHARWISEVAPAYIISHPTVLVGVMEVFEDGKIAPPRLEALLTYAESLPPDFRVRARQIFGAKTLDRYSSQEVGPIAFQCPSSDEHYHVAGSHVLVEVLDENGKPMPSGQLGRVYVTSLHNFAGPILRYELGDLAALLPRCPCGHGQPTLTNILGRERFLIQLPSGERVYVNFGARHWLKIAPVMEHRLVQTEPLVVEAEYVMDRAMTPQEEQALLSLLRHEISPEIAYVVKRLDAIPWGPSYKRQDVVSLV